MTVIEMIMKDTTGSIEKYKINGQQLENVLNDYESLDELCSSSLFDDIVNYYYIDYSGEYLQVKYENFVENEEDFKLLTSEVDTFEWSASGFELYI